MDTNLTKLPKDVVRIILYHLESDEMLLMRLVSLYFNNLITYQCNEYWFYTYFESLLDSDRKLANRLGFMKHIPIFVPLCGHLDCSYGGFIGENCPKYDILMKTCYCERPFSQQELRALTYSHPMTEIWKSEAVAILDKHNVQHDNQAQMFTDGYINVAFFNWAKRNGDTRFDLSMSKCDLHWELSFPPFTCPLTLTPELAKHYNSSKNYLRLFQTLCLRGDYCHDCGGKECGCGGDNLDFETWLAKYIQFNQTQYDKAKKEYETRKIISNILSEH
jgi:hypothetical protein